MSGEETQRSCDETRESLHAYIDGELQDAEATVVEAHIRGCDGCHQRLATLGRVRKALKKALPHMRAPKELRSRITDLARSTRRPSVARRAGTILLAAAAGIFIAAAGLTLAGQLASELELSPSFETTATPMARAVLELHEEAENNAPDVLAEEDEDVVEVLRDNGVAIGPALPSNAGLVGINYASFHESGRGLPPNAGPFDHALPAATDPSPAASLAGNPQVQVVTLAAEHVFSVLFFDDVPPGWRPPGERARLEDFVVYISWTEGKRLVFFQDGSRVVAFTSTAPDTLVYPRVARWLESLFPSSGR